MLLAAWLHNLDPFLLKFPDGWPLEGLRWYGLSYLAGFVVAGLLIRRVTTRGRSPLPPGRVMDFVVALAIGAMVGGRLGYVFFYQPSLLGFIDGPPYWGVLALNQGGMASHGGMIGTLAGAAWFAWRHKLPTLHLFDLLAFGAPLGLFFGRMANFINGELYGRACAPDFPLAVQFPQELGDHPLLEAIWAGDPEAIRYAQEVVTTRHPSQLYAGVLEGLVTFAVMLWVYRKPVKPGTAAGIFGMTYAVMRILNENFRQPDSFIGDGGFEALGMTRGQWLSVVLFVAMAGLWWFARQRKTESLGGWKTAT